MTAVTQPKKAWHSGTWAVISERNPCIVCLKPDSSCLDYFININQVAAHNQHNFPLWAFHSTLGCLAQVKVKNPNAKVKLYHLELRWQGAGTLTSVPCQVWARLHLSQHVVELSLVVKQPHLRNVRMGKEGSEVVYLLVLPCLLQFILRKASYFRPRILKGCQQRSLTDSNSFHVWPTFYK